METINHKAIQLSEQKTVRVRTIYWLSMILPHVDDDRELGNVIDDYEEEIDCVAQAFGFSLDNGSLFEQILNDGRFGFLAKVERPVMECRGYSWGHYESIWVYADNLDSLLTKVEDVSKFLGGRAKR